LESPGIRDNKPQVASVLSKNVLVIEISIGGRFVERILTRSEKIEDNDLPVIAQKYREFLKEYDG
jgi:type I restriction enzyme M protein